MTCISPGFYRVIIFSISFISSVSNVVKYGCEDGCFFVISTITQSALGIFVAEELVNWNEILGKNGDIVVWFKTSLGT